MFLYNSVISDKVLLKIFIETKFLHITAFLIGSESEQTTDAELENEESSSCGSSQTGSTDGSSGSDQKKRVKQMRLADCLKTLRSSFVLRVLELAGSSL